MTSHRFPRGWARLFPLTAATLAVALIPLLRATPPPPGDTAAAISNPAAGSAGPASGPTPKHEVRPQRAGDPLSHLTLYIVPHSHVDIGYTELQTDIEDKQVQNILDGIAAARRTAGYPAGARYVYNLEGTWAADLLLRRGSPAERAAFLGAVRQGQVALNGMYANTLTGLCRPEELVQLFRFATRLSKLTGTPLDTAMLSDVPAATWGIVPALAQAGIRYLSIAPNHGARLGGIHRAWDNRPFWWVGPSGADRVLVWYPTWGYGLSHHIHHLSARWLRAYVAQLRRIRYPYDVSYIRWVGTGDNSAPDPGICDFVRHWNAAHAWPHLVISSAHDAFAALAKRYGDRLPVEQGDLTPYWEDGAGSTARETEMSRANSDRLMQAEALWALQSPTTFPARRFADAMRLVLLYDEHSWGASVSVSAPTSPMSLAQWSIKRSYVGAADFHSRDLLSRALALPGRGPRPDEIDVYNTNSWARTGLVILPRHLAVGGDRVRDEAGRPVASQRLADGRLVLLARDVPPFASRRYRLVRGGPFAEGGVQVHGTTLDNGIVRVTVDPRTGNIVELRAQGLPGNLVDTSGGQAVNEYLYYRGTDAAAARSSGPVTVRRTEDGPLLATLEVDSSAPGCHALRRRITMAAGQPWIEIADLVDKRRATGGYFHDLAGKESVNFAFPFKVPAGQVRLEVPFGIVRPDLDQLPGANKNWFPIDRWADVSNARYGVTWISRDAPLVEVGGLTANIVAAHGHVITWRRTVGPTQRLYAWVMNNQWNTNYRAYQQGAVWFHFRLWPHGTFDPAAATRMAIDVSQPLLAVRAAATPPPTRPRLRFDAPDLIVTALKPSDDRRALIVRVWNASDHPVRSRLEWSAPEPREVSLSNTAEVPVAPLGARLALPAWGVATLRAELR